MHYGDHPPAHFHARYGGRDVQIGIEDARVLIKDVCPFGNGV